MAVKIFIGLKLYSYVLCSKEGIDLYSKQIAILLLDGHNSSYKDNFN